MVCVAAWQLARRGIAEAGQLLSFKWLSTAVVIGIGGILARSR
ncbi:MAG: hypothetical protein ACLQO1_09395 [Steroidobacteraceae bacterium]